MARRYDVSFGQPSMRGFPMENNTGVPAGWVPKQVTSEDLFVDEPGAVIEDIQFDNWASILVRAANVTIRRCLLNGGGIINDVVAPVPDNLLIEDTTILKAGNDGYGPHILAGSYTARRVKIDGVPEGFRVTSRPDPYFAGPVVIEDCYVHVVRPNICNDYHGDCVQGFNGNQLTIRNSTLWLQDSTPELGLCEGTSALFWPGDQGNLGIVIEDLLIAGGGYPIRLDTPASITGLRIVNNSWHYGPYEVVDWGKVTAWEAKLVDALSPFPNTVADIPRDA